MAADDELVHHLSSKAFDAVEPSESSVMDNIDPQKLAETFS